jgi:dienelactone hydrolase
VAQRMVTSGGRRRSGRTIVLVVVVAAMAAGTAIGLWRAGAFSGGNSTGTARSTTTTAPPDSTTATTQPPPPPAQIGAYKVSTAALVVTVPGAAATEAQLPVTVWYPVPVTARHFPLIVFSQGYWESVGAYATLLDDWASAGFVVAAPAYPHTTPTRASTSPPNRADIVNHPADLKAVIATLVTTSKRGTSVLHGVLDATEIGLAGQSDGGDVSLAVTDNPCCRLGDIKALAVLSGAEYQGFVGQYFPTGTPTVPILVTQGDDDTTNAPGCSVQIFDAAPAPKWYLDLIGATHLGPYTQSDPWATTVAKVTTDFFDAELAGETRGITAMGVDGNVSGTAQLSIGPTAPLPPGSCATAPAAS